MVKRYRRALVCLLALAASAVVVGGAAAPSASAASCEQKIFDGGGYIFDFEPEIHNPLEIEDDYGDLDEGGSNGPAGTPPGPAVTDDAYDEWGDVYLYPPGADIESPTIANKYLSADENGCALLNGEREMAFAVLPMFGLQVQHRFYVAPSPTLNGTRILNTLTNPTGAPITVTVVQGDPDALGDLGSDSQTTPHQTSDGTGVFSPTSFWGVTNDSELPTEFDSDPTLAHVWDGPGGAIRVGQVELGKPSKDNLYWAWSNVTVPAGGTVSLISYEIESAVASRESGPETALAASQAAARENQSLASLYAGMSPAEIAGTLNWHRPVPTAAIVAVKKPNAATKTALTSASTEASGVAGCAIATYAWTTSDGAAGSEPTLNHLFKAGKRSATLTVTSNCGGTATATTSFTVAKAFTLGKVKANPAKGTATIKVNAAGAGKLSLSGKGLKKQKKSLKKAGKTLKVIPTGKTLAKLESVGKAKVKVTVALKPSGGKSIKLKKSVVLKLAG
jgi:hypothetical protein